MKLDEQEPLGKVESVDTSNVIIKVDKEELLSNLQVNNLIAIRSTKTNQIIIGLVTKIMKKSLEDIEPDHPEAMVTENILKASLVGTFLDKYGDKENIFKRTLETIPTLNADCFLLSGDQLVSFMKSISHIEKNKEKSLELGIYSISEEATAYLDGNKFFQRHAVIVGNTGSGKSYTVAKILERSSQLHSVNSIVFDLHGEYQPLKDLKNTSLLKIAGPSDSQDDNGLLFLPYWLLSYEEIEAMILNRSDQDAPNQARALFDLIIEFKKANLKQDSEEQKQVLNNFTIDSPIPYEIDKVLNRLEEQDSKMVPGARGEKQGPLHGKLTRFIQRLKSKQSDKRLNFLFNSDGALQNYDWFKSFATKLMSFGNEKGIKIIDFSEVPSDILPLITGLIVRVIFSIQQWMPKDKRQPIALFCDEAHLYIPENTQNAMEEKSLRNFERIAKEGRKYGIALIVISQRPSEVNTTVLSQCGNFVSMRLINPNDQNIIKRLFPDSLGNFAEQLPILDIGESLVVGDACLLPSRIKVAAPKCKPNSATIDFWDEWSKENKDKGIEEAVQFLRKQSK